MKRFPVAALLALALLSAHGAAVAQEMDDQQRLVASSEAFLGAHPDLKYRLLGLEAYDAGKPEEARKHYLHAARYADKPAQSLLAEMHWLGRGGPQDRVLGYVWMDLAAERAYPVMIAKREAYWRAMTDEERARALEIGPGMYDEYGDDVAKRRLALLLKRAGRNITGSRVGSVGALTIYLPTPTGTQIVDGQDYYNPKFWQPEQYFEWQDTEWRKPPKGTVDVGEISSTGEAPAEGDRSD